MKENEILKEKKQMLEELFASKEYKPMRFKDLVGLLQVPRGAKHELKLLLDQLISSGKLMLDGQSRYRLGSRYIFRTSICFIFPHNTAPIPYYGECFNK